MSTLSNLFNKALDPLKNVKGIDKIIFKSIISVIKLDTFFDNVFYGFPIDISKYRQNQKKPSDPMKLGIIPIVRLFAKINYCDFVNYAISKIPRGGNAGNFNPNKPPEDDSPKLIRFLWRLQFLSWRASNRIDQFYSIIDKLDITKQKDAIIRLSGDIEDDLLTGFDRLVNEPIKIEDFPGTGNFVGSIDTGNAQTLINTFPPLLKARNTINGFFREIRSYTDGRQIPDEKFRQFIKQLDQIKKILSIVRGLSAPQSLLISAGLATLGDPVLKPFLQKVASLFEPDKAIPVLRKLIDTCNKIQRVCQNVLNIIQTAQLVITIILIVINVLLKILKFFKIMPIPSLYTTVGVINTINGVEEEVRVRVIWRIIMTLGYFSLLLTVIQLVILNIMGPINEIIRNLNLIIANLSNCNEFDPEVLKDLIDARDGLSAASDLMYLFVKNKENNDREDGFYDPNIPKIDDSMKNNTYDPYGLGNYWGVNPEGVPENIVGNMNVTDPTKKIGKYTISIITEEVIEETFTLKRRYGVALDESGTLIVQSEPTYASDSSIILKEVEQKLREKKLIQEEIDIINADQRAQIESTKNFLFNNDLKVADFPGIFDNNRGQENFEDTPVQRTSRDSANRSAINDNKDSFNANDLGFEIPDLMADMNVDEKIMFDEYDMDDPDNEDENKGMGLNAFLNKLSGGKKMRKRVRKILEKKLGDLKKDTSNPQYKGNATQNVNKTSTTLVGGKESTGTSSTSNTTNTANMSPSRVTSPAYTSNTSTTNSRTSENTGATDPSSNASKRPSLKPVTGKIDTSKLTFLQKARRKINIIKGIKKGVNKLKGK
jgi:hypothetical protein